MIIENKYNSKEKIEKYSENLLIKLTVAEVEILIKELEEVFEDSLGCNTIGDKNLEPTNCILANIKPLRKDIPISSNKSDNILKCPQTLHGKYIKA